jgi:hypothetical protein
VLEWWDEAPKVGFVDEAVGQLTRGSGCIVVLIRVSSRAGALQSMISAPGNNGYINFDGKSLIKFAIVLP